MHLRVGIHMDRWVLAGRGQRAVSGVVLPELFTLILETGSPTGLEIAVRLGCLTTKHICTHVYLYEGQKWTSGILLNCSPPYVFLRCSLLLNLEPTDWARQLFNEPQQSSCLYPLRTGIIVPTSSHLAFFVHSGHSDSDLQAGTASTLPNEPSPKPLFLQLKMQGLYDRLTLSVPLEKS